MSSFGKSWVYMWPWAVLAILGWPSVTLGILDGIGQSWVSLDGMGHHRYHRVALDVLG